MSGVCLHPQTRYDFVFGSLKLQLSRLSQRPPVVRQIAGPIAFRWRFGVFVFGPRDKVARFRESRGRLTWLVQSRIATRVIEMQMSVDDYRDLVRTNASYGAEGFSKWSTTIDSVHRSMLVRPFITDAGINENALARSFDEQAIHIHANAVLFVGRTRL